MGKERAIPTKVPTTIRAIFSFNFKKAVLQIEFDWQVQPQFKVFETFTVRTFQPVLVFDSVPVRPLNYPVTLNQLENMETFDSIPYSKGTGLNQTYTP